ncbi:inovirus Gp2 family protein [Vibrio gangliei]|uniref:inovirus Gp2 family protein n=1 Tax=Vibrio gangliei TaxID=2077090 RepID=UPI000D021163|nr:inovirus Gp2 family protein [Vibrio gangliei]
MKNNTPKNFSLYTANQYQGYSVYTRKGPLVRQYLERTFETIAHTLKRHPRVFAVRVDLRFPVNGMQQYDNQVINKFFKSLREQIKHNRAMAMRNNPYAHQTKVSYIWCREQDTSNGPHYHVLIMFNGNAYTSLGNYKEIKGNMAARIKKAWLSALGYHPLYDMDMYGALVHFCKNGVYHINTNYDNDSLADLLYRASYLCKVDTKRFECYQHVFGRSNG